MTRDDDTAPLFALSDIPAALGLLSRLPVPVDAEKATLRGARAAWAYPLAGLVLALIAGTVAHLCLWLGLPVALVAGLSLTTLVITTGALHEDGLSDAADGLWGAWEKARRLEIMKDSRIGAYGVIAIVLALGLRWQALTGIFEVSIWPALIASAMLSRAAMVPLMSYLPNARDTGLSHSVGRPTRLTALAAFTVASLSSLIFFGFAALALIVITAAAAACCAYIATSKIEGQTGDILGATQQVTETAILLTLSAVLA